MLTEKALAMASTLTELFDASNIIVQPLMHSPLEALVAATRTDDSFNNPVATGGMVSYNPDISGICYMANKKSPELGDESEHDAVMENIVGVLSEKVQNHMKFAQSIAMPIILDLADRVTAAMRERVPSKLLGMEIRESDIPAPMLNPAFVTLLRPYEDVSFDTPKLGMKLPNLTAPEIVKLMTTGTNSLDKEVSDWVAGLGDAHLLTIWENIFQQKQAGLHETTWKSFSNYIQDNDNGLDYAIVIFLIARRVPKDIPEGTDMALNQLVSLCQEFCEQSAAQMMRKINESARFVKNGTLIRKIDDRVVHVFPTVYREFIAEGGSNEMLFGNLLRRDKQIFKKDILENGVELKKAWTQHAALQSSIENEQRLIVTKGMLEKIFVAQMQEPYAGEDSNSMYKQQVMELFLTQLKDVRLADLDNLPTLCMKLVCRSRFYRTETERILEGIETCMKTNGTLTVREAALISMTNYVAFWVANLMTVENL